MSDLPTTLEEMQRDILQGDLAANSYLQPSPIASRDKELKTDNKKIIPAINEILKKITVCMETVNIFTTEFNAENDELYDEIIQVGNVVTEQLLSAQAETEELGRQIIELQDNVESQNKKIAELNNDITLISDSLTELKKNIAKGERIMVFAQKIILEKGQSIESELKASDLSDVQKQINVYAYEQSSESYKHVDNAQKMTTSSTSIYSFKISPIELRVNAETDIITFANNSSYDVILYIFR